MKPQRLIFQVSLAAFVSAPFPCLVAQEGQPAELEPLDEAFLLFLADGMEVDGVWKDPITLANLSELKDMPSEEIAWVAEQDKSKLQTMTRDIADGGSNDGEEYE